MELIIESATLDLQYFKYGIKTSIYMLESHYATPSATSMYFDDLNYNSLSKCNYYDEQIKF